MPGALDGTRVLEFTHLVAGPQCGQMLHDLGAAVTKVEQPPVGDLARSIPLARDDRRAPYFIAHNRGKRSIALDLSVPAGLEVARRLVAASDVLVENLAPGALERLGLGYAACADLNPRLVYASASTFGARGPIAHRRGADLAGLAMSGVVAATGTPEHPSPPGIVAADASAGLALVAGILAALLARTRTGRGEHVESSLYGGATWLAAGELTYALLSDDVRFERVPGGHPTLSPPGLYGIHPTADGHIALLGAGRDEWPRFVAALGRPDLEADPRFRDGGARIAHAAELREEVRATLLTRTGEEWTRRFDDARVRFAIVQDFHDVARDPQARANGYVVEAVDDGGLPGLVVGSPVRLEGHPAVHAARAPELGEHTEAVLLEHGYGWEEIARLRDAGAI